MTKTKKEISKIFLQHIADVARLFDNEKFTIVQARKLAKYYARGMSNKIELVNAVNGCNSLISLEKFRSNILLIKLILDLLDPIYSKRAYSLRNRFNSLTNSAEC